MTEGSEAATEAEKCPADYVRKQIRKIEDGLRRAMSGEYSAIRLDDADTLWGNLAMQVNVVINATRTALTRAERFEREAAAARAVRSLPRPESAAKPRDFVETDDRRTR
ncbi:MAG: hypothetical protein NXI31_15020 [bacterium]|nr:hypothetical protein [bacterium]